MHKPVLLNEVLEIFDPQPGEIYIDATVNGGGHAKAIAERIGSDGKVLGIDWDCALIENLEKQKISNLNLVCDNYANLEHIVAKHRVGPVAGIIFDLGFSSHQLEASGRGFSFLKDETLDMRYGESNERTAEHIVNTWPRDILEATLRDYGEERFAKRIAQRIVSARREKKIKTTGELSRIVAGAFPRSTARGRIHPATRTFQALRIAVNRELENIQKALPEAVAILKPGGKIAVISFHSLEDRIVKNFFREEAKKETVTIISKKPIEASEEEIRENPRARSAKLRVAEKTKKP